MDLLQVIAEPKRREVLRLIWDDELSAGDIAARFDITFGAVSQHLAVLRGAGLVDMRKEGNRRMYAANREALAPLAAILKKSWEGTLQTLAETIEREESA